MLHFTLHNHQSFQKNRELILSTAVFETPYNSGKGYWSQFSVELLSVRFILEAYLPSVGVSFASYSVMASNFSIDRKLALEKKQ
jgi:hypothetical protein